MEIIIWVLAAVGVYALVRQNTLRGLTTVRANMFLSCLKQGETVEEANQAAMYIQSMTVDRALIYAAKNRCKFEHNGSQLEMIAAAKLAGFRG